MDNKKVIEATKALQKYLKDKSKETSEKSQLFEDSDAEPLYLVVTAKRYFSEQKNLRPKLIKVPHSVWPENEKPRICLFSRDPQRAYKDALYAGENGPKIVDRVVGLSKLKGKFKRYEARRALKNDFDLFLTEPEVAPSLPTVLGKSFYGSQVKTPITVSVRQGDKIDRDLAQKEIEQVLESTVFLKPGSTLVLIRVGLTDSKPKHVAENVKAVVDYLVENVLDEGMAGIRTLSIKTSQSPALPIYYTEKIYDEADIGALEDNDESESAKRKAEEQHLDELLKEVVDEDEIKEYNREQKRRKRKGAAAADEEGDEEANEDAEEEENSE